jgi:hypothetical protein
MVNLDPYQTHKDWRSAPAQLGLSLSFAVHDVAFDERLHGRIGPNIRVEPCERRAQVNRVEA